MAEPETSQEDSADLFGLPEMAQSSPWKLVGWVLVATVLVWLLTEVAVSLVRAYQEQTVWLLLPMAFLSVCLVVLLVWAAWREIRAIRSIDFLAEREEKIKQCVHEADLRRLKQVLAPTLDKMRRRTPTLIRDFEAAVASREKPEDYLQQFDNLVLTRLDEEVRQVIRKSTMSGALGVAVAPHPALDAFIVVWRAKRMICAIGEIYGLQPTGFSALRLIKHALTSAMVAATVQKMGELSIDKFGDRMPALHVFKPVAEATTTAVRLYRLGKVTQQACRPVPLESKL
ncbi:hypothetical protein B5V00_08635 [Geothermobacter hydrogeniphilus]|uniref:DUF697 domain-containing protein n=2 Tax=Geothermobacter hydrogeniphilus TaxID=1969733 RepID=A0A1X0Y5B9_9BACT|nr:hypothetical protein B5V00_08635 [Geothermobacter hydrogeniphilus]